MNSVFIVSDNGDFIVEKHYQGVTPKVVLEEFIDAVHATRPAGKLLPSRIVSYDKKHTIFNIHRERVFFVGVSTREVNPVLMIELLQRIYEALSGYYNPVTEKILRANFSTVYLLLDEIIDSGMPATTEPNLLEMLVHPPSVIGKALQLVSGPTKLITDLAGAIGLSDVDNKKLSSEVATQQSGEGMGSGSGFGSGGGISGCGSDIWWRKGNVSYASNEIYIDIVERADVILDGSGKVISSSLSGDIMVNSKLSDLPDLTLTLRNSSVLEGASFHPCVRVSRWERDQTVSFCPPDGEFTLASYWLPEATFQPPVVLQGSLKFPQGESAGNFSLKLQCRPAVGPAGTSTGSAQSLLEEVSVVFPLPSFVSSASLSSTIGNIKFNSQKRKLIWNVGKCPLDSKQHKAEGSLLLTSEEEKRVDVAAPSEVKVVGNVYFMLKGWATSGIRLDTLDVHSTNYQSYKGCRYSTVAGKFEIRL